MEFAVAPVSSHARVLPINLIATFIHHDVGQKSTDHLRNGIIYQKCNIFCLIYSARLPLARLNDHCPAQCDLCARDCERDKIFTITNRNTFEHRFYVGIIFQWPDYHYDSADRFSIIHQNHGELDALRKIDGNSTK